jgi:hypothetical protein
MNQIARIALALPLMAGAAYADPTFTVLVRENDSLTLGNVTSVDAVAVNNSGQWVAHVVTDNPDPDANACLLRDGVIYARKGMSLTSPAGATITGFNDLAMNNLGDFAWSWTLNTGDTSTDAGLFFNDVLVIQKGTLSNSPDFTPPTPYTQFFGAKINDLNQILFVATVDDPTIITPTDRTIVLLDYDPGTNTYVETVLAKEGEVREGTTRMIQELGTEDQEFALNNNGESMYVTEVATGTADAYYINSRVVIREGQPSIEPGRNWEQIANGRPLDINNNGDYVFRANISGDASDDEMIVRNEEIFVREGQSLPAISPFTIVDFGSNAPIYIDDLGNVLWYGTWNDPDTTRNKGLFLNHELLIQDGVTTINGELVQAVRGVPRGFKMSDDGSHIIVRVELAGGIDAAVMITFDSGPTCGTADFDGDGDIGTDADIEAFFACLAGNCCDTCYSGGADFNADGDIGTDADIEAFFRVLAGGEC